MKHEDGEGDGQEDLRRNRRVEGAHHALRASSSLSSRHRLYCTTLTLCEDDRRKMALLCWEHRKLARVGCTIILVGGIKVGKGLTDGR